MRIAAQEALEDYGAALVRHLVPMLDDDRLLKPSARVLTRAAAEAHVHDVLNVFMCTGFTHDRHLYFMKASPARPGDYIEFFAEIDLLGALSACPGGDCSSEHSSDAAACYPLKVEIYHPEPKALEDWKPPEPSAYSRSHGA